MTTQPSTSPKKKAKYRPPLSNAQILHIIALAKNEQPHISNESIGLIAVLVAYKAKIENAGIQAAYSTTPKVSANSLESLGAPMLYDTVVGDVPKELYWKQCYEKLEAYGTGKCSLLEIAAANEHRYLHDLMSAEEEAEHENI